jgi:hypothetical protein
MDSENSPSNLIGFDVRSCSNEWLNQWTPERREQFLIRSEAPFPISIDRTAWPSRFTLSNRPQPDQIEALIGGSHFKLFGLWLDLAAMMSNHVPSKAPDCGIAVGLIVPEVSTGDRYVREWVKAIKGDPIHPEKPQRGWTALGYDVANTGYGSGLTNCGMFVEERPRLRQRWRPHLNEYGLFAAIDSATQFCQDANVRLEPDGPFLIFQLSALWGSFV